MARITTLKRILRKIATSSVCLATLLVVLFLSGCGGGDEKGQQPQKKALLVAVETVKKSEIVHAVDLTGEVAPYRVAQLASPAEGPVLNLRVREGDRVNIGDTLLAIGRKKGVDALIVSLREELNKEEDNLTRTRQLVDSDALPGEQLDQAKANYEKVKAQLVKAEETVQDYSITAPWKGVVSRLRVKDGDFVAPRAPLVEIYDPASIVIRAAVPERYAAKIYKGMAAAVHLDAFPNDSFSARIVRVYPYLDERMRTRTVELNLLEKMNLLPGMFGRIRLTLESIKDAVTVPSQALVVTPSGASTVYVLVEAKAVQRKVQTGIEEAGRIEVLSGLNPGDQLIVSGQEKLKDGAEVRLVGDSKPGQGRRPAGLHQQDKDAGKQGGGGE